MAKPQKTIDWESIEKEFRAGQLSNVEIGKRHGVSEGAIRKKAKKFGWKKDLLKKVQATVREKLVREAVRKPNANDEEIVQGASDQGVKIIKLHRKDITKLKKVEQKILKELDDKPKKVWVGQFQGKVITKTLEITITDRAQTLNNLANVQHKRIQLERQAWNLNDTADGETTEDALRNIFESGK